MGSTSNMPGELFPPSRGVKCPELLRLHKPDSAQHIVQFYDDESILIENVAYLAAKALAAGASSVLVATEFHLEQIRAHLPSSVLNLDALRESGRFVTADAARHYRSSWLMAGPTKRNSTTLWAASSAARRGTARTISFLHLGKWSHCFVRPVMLTGLYVWNSFGTR